jgi:signal transduction histidine kinase/ActR/RegA family two-component response regulator
MGLSKKVGALLGKKQKSEDATFGEPLNLGQIAVVQDSNNESGTFEQNDNVDSSNMTNYTPADAGERPRTSVLDLDFMAAPLAEIEQIQGKLEEETLRGTQATQDVTTIAPQPETKVTNEDITSSVKNTANIQTDTIDKSATAIASLSATMAVTPSKPPLAAQSLVLPMPGPNPYDATTQAPENISYSADIAIAHAVRGHTARGYIVFDQTGQAIEFSDKFASLLAIPEDTFKTLTCYDDMLDYMASIANLGDKDVQTLKSRESQKMREQVARGDYKLHSWKTTTKSGKILEFSNSYTPNHHLVTVVEDVTVNVEKSRLLRASLELGTAGYWSYCFTTGKSSLSDYIIDKLSEAELARVENNGLLSIIHPEDAPKVKQAFEKAIENQSRMDCEFRLVLERGDILVMRMIGEAEMSMSSGKPEVFIAFLNDLTEDASRARELHDIKELSRNKSEFLARMSHEIKTPLNAIVGMTDALRDEVETDEARETASFIADAAENLNTILSQTLEHERLSTSEIILDEDVVDLNEIMRSVSAMWKKPCSEKGLTLDVRISNELPKGLKIDSSRLRQCVTNLLSNAVKFSDSGKIVLAVAPLKVDSADPKIVIAVRDSGIGMSPEAIENIFKPFKQGNETIQRRFGGSGLGMSITQHIIKAMDGHIKVQSKEGEGTTIALTLPLKLANAIDTAPARPIAATPVVEKVESRSDAVTHSLPAQAFHAVPETKADTSIADAPTPTSEMPKEPTKIRKNVTIEPTDYSGFDVLVVEDNPINQAVVKKLLTNHINSMSFAFQGEEALSILETKSFDVILMDIHMPVKDGIETTLEIRNSGKPWADTVIVALTADPDYQQKRVCRNIGMNDALSKPVKRQELLDILQKVLDDKRNHDGAEAVAKVA